MTTTLEHVPLSRIQPDPNNPRKAFDLDDAFLDSIRTHGVLQPVTLRSDGNGGYIIVAGERRYRAAKEANLTSIPAQIITASDATVEALVENLHREDLNAIEEGDAYIRLHETMTSEQIAQRVGRPAARVLDRIALAQLPDLGREIVLSGDVPLDAIRRFVPVAKANKELGAALLFAARASGSWRDPWEVYFALDRIDPTKRELPCPDCDGEGGMEVGDGWEHCDRCKGRGEIVEHVKGEKLPPFFAIACWHSTPLADKMVKQLAPAARTRIAAAAKLANDEYEKRKKGQSWAGPPPEPSLHSPDVRDAAMAGGFGFDFGNQRYVVTDLAFANEYLPGVYEQSVQEYITPPKTPKSSTSSGGVGLGDAEKEKRAKERAQAAEERANARAFNERLGVVIQTRLGEVPVTLDAVKLMVATILESTKRHQAFDGKHPVAGEGPVLYHRFTRVDWPTTKAGDFKLPHKADDRHEFASKVYAQAEKDLAAARTPAQAFGVLVRFLAHGLVDLRGLPFADIDRMGDVPHKSSEWRRFVLARLPKSIRDKVPASNGVPGRSQAWSD